MELHNITNTNEVGRWKARDVEYFNGSWKALSSMIPRFTDEDFKIGSDGEKNPFLRQVARQPLAPTERPVPIGVVSNTYQLVQHVEVVEKCFEGLSGLTIDTPSLNCEVGLSQPYGEWMHFRITFPEKYSYTPKDGKPLNLRLECVNSVDGSCRLEIFIMWFRLVCSNGLVVKEIAADLRKIHNYHLDIKSIPKIIAQGINHANPSISQIQRWENSELNRSSFGEWIDKKLSTSWGVKAACRVWHICTEGNDIEFTNPFAPGKAREKPTKPLNEVPGAARPARNLYDVCQALSWVATHKAVVEERIGMQKEIPDLIESVPCLDPRAPRQTSLFGLE